MKTRIKSIVWAFSLAWKVNKRILIVWFSLMAVVSVLPSIALYYNREIIKVLNDFVSTGVGTIDEVLPFVFVFGIITALVGISNRLNVEFIYSVMYNKYYFGMAELLMDAVQNFSMEELLKKDINDEYYSVVLREGSLTDVISGFCSLVGKFVGLVSLLVVAFTISIPIFVVSLFYIAIVFWVNLKYTEKQRYSWKKIRGNERLAGHYSGMPFSSEYAKELRVFGNRNELIEKWKQAHLPIEEYHLKKSFDVGLRSLIGNVAFYLFLGAMVAFSIFSVVHSQMDAASLLVIFTMCLDINSSISGAARMIVITDHGLYAVERQYRIFSNRTKMSSKPTENQNIVLDNNIVFEAKNLSYSYNGSDLALDDVSFKIKKGETIALVGVNGSGKSTLVKLLLQLYKPFSGELFFCGKEYSSLPDGFLKDKIGAFFQDYHLFHMPIGENVGFGDISNVEDDSKVDCALEKGGAIGFVKKLPKGKDTFVYKWVEETGADFSGGERQKIAISRTHMSDKDILIFDEPASALDPISELEQFMNIKRKTDGRTAILISHRVGFARLADRIILLNNGKIAEIGIHDELMKNNGLYAEFFNAQAQWYKKAEDI